MQLSHPNLDRRVDLLQARPRPVRPVRQPGQALAQIPRQPRVDRLSRRPEPGGDLRLRRAVLPKGLAGRELPAAPRATTPTESSPIKKAEQGRCQAAPGTRP